MRIAVTGVGLVTPHGDSVADSWLALLRGDCAGRRLPAGSGGALVGIEPYWSGAPACGVAPPGAGRFNPVALLACRAAREAVEQAHLHSSGVDRDRFGCVFGTSKGELDAFARLQQLSQAALPTHHTGGDTLALWELVPPSVPARTLASLHDCRGPVLAPIAACATGLVAICRAAALIRDGVCDVVLTGSSDASLQPAVIGSFRRLGVLASPRPDPADACRPFDARRSGFLIGEGAGALILERWDHAVARGATPLAEWVDGLQYADPFGLTLLDPDPAPLVRLIGDLLRRTDLTPADIDAVSLHGTGTRINDAYEAQALARVCGSALDRTLGFGLKGGIGHLLGAAGSVETVAAICALRDQQLPPTVNCDCPADDCPLPLTHGRAVPRPLTHILKLSLGFGGHLAAGVLRRV